MSWIEMPQIEMLSVWNCIYCKAQNDHTNPVRCWQCNKKKSKASTVKRILAKRAKDLQKSQIEAKKEIISKIDTIEPKQEHELEFDTSKLKID